MPTAYGIFERSATGRIAALDWKPRRADARER
jgi:hypothetical protein